MWMKKGIVAVLALLMCMAMPVHAKIKKKAKAEAVKTDTTVTLDTIPYTPAHGPKLHATSALLMDLSTGKVLYEKASQERMVPSSMSKMMTVYMVFDALKKGRIKMDDTFTVSERAWRMQGSKMFLDLGAQVSVRDLLLGAVVQSGNDACVVLAEGLAGSEESFVHAMNQTAKEMGLTNTNFVNSTGWPDDHQYSCAKDLALIALKTMVDFPEYYPMYNVREFTFNNIRQMNRNPLLSALAGADGLKTGHTDAGGYGLAASAVMQGRRLLMVINGSKSMKQRAEDAKTLMQWGFSYYASPLLYKAAQEIELAPVWLGTEERVPLTTLQDIFVTVPRHHLRDMQVSVDYTGPLSAPLKAGQAVGTLTITVPEQAPRQVPLVVSRDVAKANIFTRMGASLRHLIYGHA